MHIIPAIDILNGKCVRLSQGDYASSKTYNSSPLEVAKEFEVAGFKKLHLVDLDGAKSKHIVNHKVLQNLACNTSLQIDFGGGIKSDEDIEIAFANGASQVTVGSIAVQSKETVMKWIAKYGAEKIILGADVRDEKIAINGWEEQSSIDLFDFLESYKEAGIEYVICTDIAKDGMLQGSSISLYKKILHQFPSLKLIASGGVSSLQEIQDLENLKLFGAIVGKAIYEEKILLVDLIHLQNRNRC
jgi:phosphoribosylformimino-5-aminoimidazole carboxamide ribotide isomerase